MNARDYQKLSVKRSQGWCDSSQYSDRKKILICTFADRFRRENYAWGTLFSFDLGRPYSLRCEMSFPGGSDLRVINSLGESVYLNVKGVLQDGRGPVLRVRSVAFDDTLLEGVVEGI